jgi:hypothetical protein
MRCASGVSCSRERSTVKRLDGEKSIRSMT